MKTKALNGFDLLAPCYDLLARLVFGKSIRNAQFCFLDTIPVEGTVLILGGGTGWLLTELIKRRPNCEVWFVETSKKMIAKAKHGNEGPKVHFIHGKIDDVTGIVFDVVIINFFLDLFSHSTLKKLIPVVMTASKSSGLWLATDFVDRRKWWQYGLLKIMYIFFRLTCRIEANQLPDWQNELTLSGLQKIQSTGFYKEFIESTVWLRRAIA